MAAGPSRFADREIILLPTSTQEERDRVKTLTGIEVVILDNKIAANLGENISYVNQEDVGRTSERFQVDAGAVIKEIGTTFPSTASFLGAYASVAIFAYHPGFGMRPHTDNMPPRYTGRLVARITESPTTLSSVQIEIGALVYEITFIGSAVYSAPMETFNRNAHAVPALGDDANCFSLIVSTLAGSAEEASERLCAAIDQDAKNIPPTSQGGP